MDFIHVDVQRPLSELPHTVKINCNNPDATQINTLFAIEGVVRRPPRSFLSNHFIFLETSLFAAELLYRRMHRRDSFHVR